MADQIQPHYLCLADLLNKRLFNIPEYQRSYSWSSRERKHLFKDIKAIHNAGGNASHFMATIVCLRRDEVKLGTDLFKKLDIVDGQQRLTTLIILLNAIRRALDKNKKKQRKHTDELAKLLVKPEGDNLLLLQTNHDASHYFANYMRNGTAPKPDNAQTLADKELLSAIQECKKFVKEWKNNNNTLIELVALIKDCLSFILLEISDEKFVYTVFEVLNSRGMEVSWLDRLKSILMRLAFLIEEANHGGLISDLRKIWRDIYASIGLRQDLSTEVLQFTATLYSKDKPSKPYSESDAVDLLVEMADGAAQIRKIAHWLLDVTKACDKVMSNPRHNAVTRIAQARLLAVAIHISKFKDDDRQNLLDEWERISFLIYGLHANYATFRPSEYCRLSWIIINSELPSNDILDHIRKLGKKCTVKDAIKKYRGDNFYTNWTEQLRYFLLRYEEYLAEKNGQKADNIHWERVWAIEHIRPQKEAPDEVKHTLGNLMLLPPITNSKLQDKPPQQKADEYKKTRLYHAIEVAEMLKKNPKWSKKACKQREKKLLSWAADEWAEGKSTN